jgi:hypothetical protein
MDEDLYQLSQEVSTASGRCTLALSDFAFAEQEAFRLRNEISAKRRELENLEGLLEVAIREELKRFDHANLCSSMLEKANKELREFTQESEDNKKSDPNPESMTAKQRNNSGVHEIFVGRIGGLFFGPCRPPTC